MLTVLMYIVKEEALGQWNHPSSAEAWKADQERRA